MSNLTHFKLTTVELDSFRTYQGLNHFGLTSVELECDLVFVQLETINGLVRAGLAFGSSEDGWLDGLKVLGRG